MIKIDNLCYSVDNNKILKDICIQIQKNSFVGIVGANGCGKSTLLKNIYKFYHPDCGEILIDNHSVKNYSNKELAKKLSVLTQKQNMNFDFLVEEIIEMGLYAHDKSLFKESPKDYVERALESVGMGGMEKRSFLSLSGGEMQRALIARSLIQDSNIIVLDEPTNHLDIKYQIQIMDLVKNSNKTVLAVIHDINMASKYCDYIYGLKDGKVVVQGNTKNVITKENIKKIFDVDCEIISHPLTSKPLIIF